MDFLMRTCHMYMCMYVEIAKKQTNNPTGKNRQSTGLEMHRKTNPNDKQIITTTKRYYKLLRKRKCDASN